MRHWKLAMLGAVLVASCGDRSGALSAASDQAARDSISAAMARYMVAARAVDPAAIASFFTPTGVLFEPGITPIQTPDSIRAFVASFPGVRVDSATAVADTIEVFGRTALLWGSYFERLAFPGQPISEQEGRFVIEWIEHTAGRWLIHRYYRIPLPGTRLLDAGP